jgi:hypothetical protein
MAYPVTIAESTLAIDEDGTTTTVTIPAGTYWPYRGTEYTGYDGLYKTIEDLLNASAATGTYSFEASVPTETEGEGAIRRGLALTQEGHTPPWGIDWSASTLDPRLLGYSATQSTAVTTTTFTLSSPREPLGVWIPQRVRREASRNVVRDISAATDDVGADNFHQADYGSRTLRAFEWRRQPAGAVINGKASSDFGGSGNTYGDIAGLEDDNGSFERLWTSMSKRDDIIVFYEMDPVTIDADESGLKYEIVRLLDNAQRFRDAINMSQMGGEFYDVRFAVQVLEGDRSD